MTTHDSPPPPEGPPTPPFAPTTQATPDAPTGPTHDPQQTAYFDRAATQSLVGIVSDSVAHTAEARGTASLAMRVLHPVLVVIGALAMTAALFLILPLIQMISEKVETGIVAHSLDAGELPPPPPTPEDEPPEEEEEKDDPPPELDETPQNLDLDQLELVLNPTFGDGLGATFKLQLDTVVKTGESKDALFSLADLDQKPRAVYQPNPAMNNALRRKRPATVWILFIVNEQGRVESPRIQKSTNPEFERPALNALKKWKFEPGKRNGKPVRFRMRIPFTFSDG